MTRGNFLLITDTANWMSIQFNGDMYPSCNGKFVYHMLESVETKEILPPVAVLWSALKKYLEK